MKTVSLDAHFPELKGNRCYAVGRGSGSTTRAAFSRAIDNLLKSDNVSGKRFSAIKMTVAITNGGGDSEKGVSNETTTRQSKK